MKRKPTLPKAPTHLKAATATWWSEIVEQYELEAHHERLLTAAAEAWDRHEQARAILAKEGLTFQDRFDQPRGRPEIAVERDSRLGFARLLRELGLDIEPPGEIGRPPKIGGGR